MFEPRSLPELVGNRATGGLAGEEFCEGLTFADLVDPEKVPEWLRFLHDPHPWAVPCGSRVAILAPLTVLMAARSVARAIALNENDRVTLVGERTSLRLRVAGVAGALYAGASVSFDPKAPTVTVSEEAITMTTGERFELHGWPETVGVCALSTTPRRLGQPLERMEAAVVDGELVVRGPLMMDRYRDDPIATLAVFAKGWFHTGQAAVITAGSEIELT